MDAGQPRNVGRPRTQLLLRRGATVTVAHAFTADLAAVTRPADVVVVAPGVRGLIGPERIKRPGPPSSTPASTAPPTAPPVTSAPRNSRASSAVSRPVPGGGFSMTIAMHVVNTLRAAEWADEYESVPA
ncbi:hypothetical protein ACLGIH_34605 [Streptomyces sp. HMX87]|uniref:hypothetical protein n=1 Tax=Streptomyces sp. HMX87 TaxID=3390849 RepID=UPI003A86BDED